MEQNNINSYKQTMENAVPLIVATFVLIKPINVGTESQKYHGRNGDHGLDIIFCLHLEVEVYQSSIFFAVDKTVQGEFRSEMDSPMENSTVTTPPPKNEPVESISTEPTEKEEMKSRKKRSIADTPQLEDEPF
ncbi:hypothetical protein ABEB36_006909 [Hypothenemus hampei]|uniref:Uncharacterized protein n=1 Tax=Hypothenemus hampei TaxID=57062 RepID=A0ABD1EUE3_HYPHA